MTKVLIVTGSVRKGRIADKILDQVQAELQNYPELEISLADLKELPMAFFDSELTPSHEDYKPTDENAQKFSQLVTAADKVLILTPEYNHSTPAVLKNAIDWLYKEWQDKPIAMIGYGWVGGARSIKNLHTMFEFLKPQLIEPEGNLRFTQEIEIDGTPIGDKAKDVINSVLQAL